MKTKIKIIVILFLLTITELKPQVVYDTLYSFPDTTTFYNTTIFVVDDITNIAVKFWVDSSWENYQVENIIFSAPEGIDTNGYTYYFISLGETPEDSIIYVKQVFYHEVPFFPEYISLPLDTPLIINKGKSFYLSGGFFNLLTISQDLGFAIPGQYAFWYTPYEWVEYIPVYFNLKVVVKKNLTDIDDANIHPMEFSLEQNYPNPFNPITTIKFAIPVSGNIILSIFNSIGEKVETLHDGFLESGYHKLDWNASTYSSGIYFYRLDAENFKSVKKMILLK